MRNVTVCATQTSCGWDEAAVHGESAYLSACATDTPAKRPSERRDFGSEEAMRRGSMRVLAATPNEHRARVSSLISLSTQSGSPNELHP